MRPEAAKAMIESIADGITDEEEKKVAAISAKRLPPPLAKGLVVGLKNVREVLPGLLKLGTSVTFAVANLAVLGHVDLNVLIQLLDALADEEHRAFLMSLPTGAVVGLMKLWVCTLDSSCVADILADTDIDIREGIEAAASAAFDKLMAMDPEDSCGHVHVSANNEFYFARAYLAICLQLRS